MRFRVERLRSRDRMFSIAVRDFSQCSLGTIFFISHEVSELRGSGLKD